MLPNNENYDDELDEDLELFEDYDNITDIYTLGEIVNFKYVKLN